MLAGAHSACDGKPQSASPRIIAMAHLTAVFREGMARLTAESQRPPVVFAPVNDPVDAGIVANLRRPGGNITGIRRPTGDGLRLQWLKRIVPAVRNV